MKQLNISIKCPWCGIEIKVPFFGDLKAQAIEDYDLAEISAQEELSSLHWWLRTTSLWGLIKWYFKRSLK